MGGKGDRDGLHTDILFVESSGLVLVLCTVMRSSAGLSWSDSIGRWVLTYVHLVPGILESRSLLVSDGASFRDFIDQ